MLISATLSPNISDKESLKKLIENGCNLFRLNFSWGTHEEYAEIIQNIKEVASDLNTQVLILQDLQGPKLRLQNCYCNEIQTNQIYQFSFENKPNHFTLEAEGLYNKENIGKKILIKDGQIKLRITNVDNSNKTLETIAETPGSVKNKNGCNAPGIQLGLKSISQKDKKDLDFALSQNIDIISLSFIHNEHDLINLKEIGLDKAKVLAKIETEAAVQNINSILKHADYCMIARGDLGVEIGLENLAKAQLKILESAKNNKVPTLIATEVLKTMLEYPHPSRAEVNDIYYGLENGAKGFILTNETVVGKHPFLAIKWLAKLVNSYTKHK